MMKQKTTISIAMDALDRIDCDLDGLVTEKESTVGSFRTMSDRLADLNGTIAVKIDLCTSMIESLKRIREELESQRDDNSRIRGKILDLLGEPVVTVSQDNEETPTDGSDDFDTVVEE